MRTISEVILGVPTTPVTTRFEWSNSNIQLDFAYEHDGPLRLTRIRDLGTTQKPNAIASEPLQPLVEIMTPHWGNERSSNSGRYSGTHIGSTLRYRSHETSQQDGISRLAITQEDSASGLVVTSIFEAYPGVASVRSVTTVGLAEGSSPVTLWAVSSFATGAVISDSINDVDVWEGRCTWSAENRWSSLPLRAAGLASMDVSARGETCRNAIKVTSFGSWSSGEYVPAGAIENRETRQTLAWQVEHNGAWHWEVGERPDWSVHNAVVVGSEEAAGRRIDDGTHDGGFVAVLGPTDQYHQWAFTVTEYESFTSVPVTVAVGDSFDGAFGNLAQYRRAARRAHPQNQLLPVIFNDYMNTLDGDPTEAKLLPLIDAAAKVGAEYFCIDAGWYDDTAGWWASVGDWIPSTIRFPHGLTYILEHIREKGMAVGLWLEPEVVGVDSHAAKTLPNDAFLQRGGVRIRERDRYLLDLRSEAARRHLDEAVDRLVSELDIKYFKLDYNVTPGPGTDINGENVGHGLLEHNRALVTWLDSVLDRHPALVLENCGSGALRSDFAMLSRLQLQSTSDQRNPLLYPAIAVGALVHILPEQAANWSYPQAGMTDEMIAFNMCTGIAGRLYQAGLLDLMDDRQLALVAAGVQMHKDTRAKFAQAIPRFPTGVPNWNDAWITVAFDCRGEETYLIAWRQEHAAPDLEFTLAHLSGKASVEQVYPLLGDFGEWSVNVEGRKIQLSTAEQVAAARLYRITVQ